RPDRSISEGWLALPSRTAAVVRITSPVYDLLAEALAPQMTPDLDIFCEAIAAMFSEVEFYALDTVGANGDPLDGWGILFDVDNPRLSREALRWLGQWVGEAIPVGASRDAARAQIHAQPNKQRGTLQAIIDAARDTLVGPRSVIVRERDPAACPSEPAYGLTVITYTGQTPDPSATEAAINAVLPAGIVLNYLTLDGQDWQSVHDNFEDWSEVDESYASWQSVRDDEAT
ncbi:MAG TPA: hypothetical protein VNS09_03785, partial [Solirubrobacter sp.]|nr:hypothetical protein [Solirubrobacter sp.]